MAGEPKTTLLRVFYVSQQPYANLCWAACCSMAMTANNYANASLIDVAQKVTGQPPPQGDKAWEPDQALTKVELAYTADAKPLAAESLAAWIEKDKRPIEVMWAYRDGSSSGHVGLVIGYDEPSETWCLCDPLEGPQWVSWDFLNTYGGTAWWKRTYYSIGKPLPLVDLANAPVDERSMAHGLNGLRNQLNTLNASGAVSEPIEIWRLDKVQALPSGRLQQLAAFTGFRRARAATAPGFSITTDADTGAATARVHAIGTSALSQDFEIAMHVLDGAGSLVGQTARLLTIPSRLVQAVWLSDAQKDQLIFVRAPQTSPALDPTRRYSAAEFMSAVTAIEPCYRPASLH